MASSTTTFLCLSTWLFFFSSLLVLSFHVPVGRCLTMNRVRNVTVINYLGEGIKLYIHCQSKDDDIHEYVLNFREWFRWGFESDDLLPDKLYWCKARWTDWMNVHGTFNVFDAKRDNFRCDSMCWWKVEPDGLFCLNNWSNKYELVYYIQRV